MYEGDWSKEGKKHGIGRLNFTDGTAYEGRFHHGLFHGYGSLRLPDATTYEGMFSLPGGALFYFSRLALYSVAS